MSKYGYPASFLFYLVVMTDSNKDFFFYTPPPPFYVQQNCVCSGSGSGIIVNFDTKAERERQRDNILVVPCFSEASMPLRFKFCALPMMKFIIETKVPIAF